MKTILSFVAILFMWAVVGFNSITPAGDVKSDITLIENYRVDRAALQEEMLKYIATHPAPVIPKGTTSSCSFTQVTLLRYQCLLTTYSVTGIDSLQSVTPGFSTGYFDASLYNNSFDSLLKSNDSTLVTVVCNESSGSGTDSVRLIRLGAFSSQDVGTTAATYQMDTLATAKTTLCQRWLPSNGTANGKHFPFWGVQGKGIACTDVNATIYFLNVKSTSKSDLIIPRTSWDRYASVPDALN